MSLEKLLKKKLFKKKTIYKCILAIQYFEKLINLFHKNYLNKLIVILILFGITLPITRSIIKSYKANLINQNQKWDKLANSTYKKAKKNQIKFRYYF